MRLAIYVADDALRAALLAWAQAHGHAVLESAPEVPAALPGAEASWPHFALEAAVARLEPAAVLVDAAQGERWAGVLWADEAALAARDRGEEGEGGGNADTAHEALLAAARAALLRIGRDRRRRTATAAAPGWLWAVGSVAEAQAWAEEAATATATAATAAATTPIAPAATVVTAATDQARLILFDEEYAACRQAARLHRPDPAEAPAVRQTRLMAEEARFVLLLQMAREDGGARLSAARAYLDALSAAEADLEEEVAYRLAHGSWKVFWLREHLCRLAGVIAHLLPGTEPEHFPPPAAPLSARFGHLHWRAPLPFSYPLICLLIYRPNPTIAEVLQDALASGFEPGREELWTAEQGQRLWGVCAYLRAVARAHLAALDLCLDEESAFHRQPQESTPLPRAIGVVLEFWGMHGLLSLRTGLRRTVRGVLAGTTYVPAGAGRPLPTYPELVAATAASMAAAAFGPGVGGGGNDEDAGRRLGKQTEPKPAATRACASGRRRARRAGGPPPPPPPGRDPRPNSLDLPTTTPRPTTRSPAADNDEEAHGPRHHRRQQSRP